MNLQQRDSLSGNHVHGITVQKKEPGTVKELLVVAKAALVPIRNAGLPSPVRLLRCFRVVVAVVDMRLALGARIDLDGTPMG